ncbi:hypothetical protein DEO72_LG3g2106 [Vigna unguiculata]|uniref:Nucleic acid-binding n=1 Tax=Vigna unguiculata TaxID=3917 RepID=A0A4D6LFY0_VIGUN|nr:hypothetical protein DEO72_LG3g2106 [Vigna unguiculata]
MKVFPRYRIKIRVRDSSDSTTLVLFARDATILLKKSCADMLESHDRDVYVGNGEFSRGKQRVVNGSTVDIAEDLLAKFTNKMIDSSSQSLELIKDNATLDDANNSLKRESVKKTVSLDSIEEDNVPLKLLKRNIKKEK